VYLEGVVCSGEARDRGEIHVFQGNTMRVKSVLYSAHENGIVNLRFSRDGQFIISIGRNFSSLQVFRWKQQREVCFRHLGINPVFALAFNPFDSREFVEAGYQHIAIWKMNGNHLTNKHYVKVFNEVKENPKKIILCIDFVNYKVSILEFVLSKKGWQYNAE
jgi:hypothetical protein